jgi:hypothetical protein
MRKDRRLVFCSVLLGAVVTALVGTAVVVHFIPREPADPESRLYSRLCKEGMFAAPDCPLAIYVKEVRGRTLLSPVLKWRNEEGEIDTVMMAREGELSVDREAGELQVLLREGRSSKGLDFVERSFCVALPPSFLEEQ